MTSRLLAYPGESCASLRTTWKSIRRFGIVPQMHFQHEWPGPNLETCGLAYAFAHEYRSLSFVRFDGRDRSGEESLVTVRNWLAAGFAVVFGFPVYTSITESSDISEPTLLDAPRGGQAVMALGYDDERRIRSDKGALLIRNSWGPQWGDNGYGWLPYSYVRRNLAADFWTVLKQEWIESEEFHRPPA